MCSASIQAVLFDLDDTLYPEVQYVQSGYRAVASYLETVTGRGAEFLFARLVQIQQAQGRERRTVFDEMLKELGIYSPLLVAELVWVYRDHRPAISLFPDVPATLRLFRKAGLKLGIVTDGLPTMQRKKIEALNLDELVDTVIYTYEIGPEFAKPHPFPFVKAIKTLGVESRCAVFVGNDPAKDFPAPNELGMTSVHVKRVHQDCGLRCEARFHVQNLVELAGRILESGGKK